MTRLQPCHLPTCSFEIRTELQPLPDAALRVRRERLLDILHLDSARTILTLPEQPIDEHLQEVSDVIVGLLRVGTGDLDQRAFLAYGVDVIDATNEIPGVKVKIFDDVIVFIDPPIDLDSSRTTSFFHWEYFSTRKT